MAAAVVTPSAFAQSATANLRGKATPGAEVTAFNPQTGLTRHAKAGCRRLVHHQRPAAGLLQGRRRPGHRADGHADRRLDRDAQPDRRPAALPRRRPVRPAMEGVTVNATTLTEVKTPEVGDDHFAAPDPDDPAGLAQLPRVRRHRAGHGLQRRLRRATPRLRGGAQNASSVNVYIDGVGQKSYVKEGGVSGQIASQGNPFPQLAIGEYKVITSQLQGRVRPGLVGGGHGRNQVRHERIPRRSVRHLHRRHATAAAPPAEEDADKATSSFEKEYGFALGGPIIKDQMHFFITYEAEEVRHADHRQSRASIRRRACLAAAGRRGSAARGRRTCRSTRSCTSARSTGS